MTEQPQGSSGGREQPYAASPTADAADTRSRPQSESSEGPPPPLPPRPDTLNLLDEGPSPSGALRPTGPPNLQGKATTAVSLTDIGSRQEEGGKEDHSAYVVRPGSLRARASLGQLASSKGSETGDSASIRSSAPNAEAGDVENIFNDFAESVGVQQDSGLLKFPEFPDDDFANEFEPVGEVEEGGENEDILIGRWKAKRKHYLILSAAGKPIWTRHGDGSLISTYVGVIQTIISYYEDAEDRLSSFSAGDTKFVVVTRGPLHLVAISRILESDDQLRLQLEALYMQVLSTLTLPSLNHLFSVRPSTDLKRPLQGSGTLLSTLADSFTRGSPTTLLSALECLKIRKSYRQTINNALLKSRANGLLYGLVAAGGRLVSVVRPRKHSLHPGDLQILFNMIFEAEGVKAGGGESWIPVCLPGFNNSGYLYMYVDFLDLRADADDPANTTKEESVAIVLISADKESFFEMQSMRNTLVEVRSHLSRVHAYTNNSCFCLAATRENRQSQSNKNRHRQRPPQHNRHRPGNGPPPLPIQIPRERPIHNVSLRPGFLNHISPSKVCCFST